MGEPAVADGESMRGEETLDDAIGLLRSALTIIDRCGLSAAGGALLQEVIERLQAEADRA